MQTITHARIAGLGSCLPSQEIPSSYWDTYYELPSGTITQRTGIEIRFRCAPHENGRTLAATAVRAACEQAKVKPRNVGLLIDTSACSQQPLPGNAAGVLEQLGESWRGIPGLDVRNTCLGFLAGLHVAQALIAHHHHIVVVSAETPFAGLNFNDQDSAPLFGEAAAAAVISRSPHPRAYYYDMETFAQHRSACEVPAGGHRQPPFAYSPENDHLYRFKMDGARLHRIASKALPALVRKFRQSWPTEANDWWVPHPASGPAVELMRRRLDIPPDRFFSTIKKHGNLISAGIPFQLAQAQATGKAHSFITVGTAAGYSQAIMAWRDSHAP